MRRIVFLILGFLFLIFPNVLWAQVTQEPWDLEGVNFQITNSLEGNYLPAIAASENLYLAVWYKKTPAGFDIYGARITRDGKVLDEGEDEIPICIAADDQMFPAVLWDGDNFFVAWQDRRSGRRWDIYGAKVTPDGQVLYGPEVTPDGEVLSPGGIPISIGKRTYDQSAPAISFDGKNYLVVWQGKRSAKSRNIYFRMISKDIPEDGIIPEENPVIPLSPSLKDQASPAVAFNGGMYFITWQEKRRGKFWGIIGARLLPWAENLEKLDPEGIEISPMPDQKVEWDRSKPSVSWNGRFYFIVWTSQREKGKWFIEGKRLYPYSRAMDPEDFILQSDTSNKILPSIMWSGDEEQYLLLWEDEPEGNSKIYEAPIAPDSDPIIIGDGVRVSEGTGASYPAVSRTGDEMLIIWQGLGPEDTWQIYGQRLSKLVTF